MFNSCATAQMDSQRHAESELSKLAFQNAIFSWPSDSGGAGNFRRFAMVEGDVRNV